jgi:NAD(P)-dependent dehydrogenase (short-subunit alcohol dehydrogenase family)
MRTFRMNEIPEAGARFPDLAGGTALISGGERGIGQGIAAFLGRQGMNVVLAGISDEEGRAARSGFEEAGIVCRWINADVSRGDEAENAIATTVDEFGKIDVLVNNAVRNKIVEFLEYDDETWDLAFEKNLRMVYNLSLHGGKRMADAGGGAIVNISSVGGLRAHRRSVAYDTTKGAVDAMTRALALDLAPNGIRVNAIAPGAIMNRVVSDQDKPFRDRQAAGIPLGRVGNVTDVAVLAGFLASGAASYITGQTIYVDGGLVAQLTPPGIYI